MSLNYKLHLFIAGMRSSLCPPHNPDLLFSQGRKARRPVYLAVCGLYLALEAGFVVAVLGTRYRKSIYTSRPSEHIDLCVGVVLWQRMR